MRAHGTPQQVVTRCRIVLLTLPGLSDLAVAVELGVNRHTCRLWRERFVKEGPDFMWEVAEGRGRKPRARLAQKIVEATLYTKPAGQKLWSTRTMAKAQGVDPSTVCRIWQDHGLQPHRQATLKLSRDPQFVPKLLDVVGVYLNPPQNAVVLCVDEKVRFKRWIGRSRACLGRRGRCGTWTHDYVRNGTTTMFAALNVATGKISGHCFPQHRHQEFLRFLRQLDAEYAADLELHLVLDNYGTHKTPQVRRWFAKHPGFKMHYIPTSSSWLNLVERWFGELTGKAVRRGSFASVPDLIAAIEAFMVTWNRDPNRSSGRPRPRTSSPRSNAADGVWNRSNPAAPWRDGEKRRA